MKYTGYKNITSELCWVQKNPKRDSWHRRLDSNSS